MRLSVDLHFLLLAAILRRRQGGVRWGRRGSRWPEFIASLRWDRDRMGEGRMRQSRPSDSMFSAGKVGSRAEPWPGLAVYHTSC